MLALRYQWKISDETGDSSLLGSKILNQELRVNESLSLT